MQALGQGEGGGGGRPEPKHLWSMQRFVQSTPMHMLSSVCACAILCTGERLGACQGARVWVQAVGLRARGLRGTHALSCDTLVPTSFAHSDHVHAHRFIRYWTLERKRNVAILPLLGVRAPDIHSEAIAQK